MIATENESLTFAFALLRMPMPGVLATPTLAQEYSKRELFGGYQSMQFR
jgi:hypothetical protein